LSTASRLSKRTMAIVVLVIVVVALLTGAYYYTLVPPGVVSSTMSSTSVAAATNKTLLVDDSSWPTGDLNRLWSPQQNPYPDWLEYAVYQPLITVNLAAMYNSGNIEWKPGLANNWTVSPDGTTWTFNLRPNIKFTSGNPLNAYQVWMEMYGFYYLSGNITNWMISYDLFDMSNVNFGPATIALITQSGLVNPSPQALSIMTDSSWPIYAPTPDQIVFHLKNPFPYFPGMLVAFMGLIFDTQWALDHGGFGTPVALNTYFDLNPIPGTGPYVVSQVVNQQYVKLTQNPNYWGANLTPSELADNPALDPGHATNIIIYNRGSDVGRFEDLETGAAQIVPIEQSWNLVTASPDKFAFYEAPPWAGIVKMLALNCQNYPTNNTYVRQAIVHAINYTDISQKVFLGYSSPFMGPEYPAWKDYYDLGNLSPYTYNITLAKEYLAKANIANMPTLEFRVLAGCQNCYLIAQIVQSDLAQIGIPVSIDVLQHAQYHNYGSWQHNYQVAPQLGNILIIGLQTWAPGTLTPGDYWVSFVNNASLAGAQAIYTNPLVQNCVNAFSNTADIPTIQAACTKAQLQIYNDAPIAWLGVLRLTIGDGSLVWQKGVIGSFYLDPVWTGSDDLPLLNTVTFASGS